VHDVAARVVVRDKDVVQWFQNPTAAAEAAAAPSLAVPPRRGVAVGTGRAMSDTSTEVRYERASE
jgi:DNA-binding transcriptional regulator LsrR (DeoR family)